MFPHREIFGSVTEALYIRIKYNNMSTENTKEVLPLSFGQKAVRINFNAAQDDDVAAIKNTYANLIDRLKALLSRETSREDKSAEWKVRTGREFSLAITELESSGHWAVKGLTAHFQD